ncbi:MAG: DNA polymerase III subunit alpha, partial [Rikenellaceae bacterium]|nr:DNA polymerase III subunit alpha [Rikenellaceae bacterium]
IEERRTGGMYRDLFDFVERVNLTSMNRKTFESLALAGAFDSLTDFHRSRFFSEDRSGKTYIEMLLRYGNIFQSSKTQSGGSLFGDIMQAVEINKPQMPDGDEWDQLQTLAKERELVGLYLSAHPLDKYKMLIENMCTNSLDSLSTPQMHNRDFIIAGMVTSVTNAVTKRGDNYGRFTIEDFTGSHEFVLFRKDYENYRPFMFKDYQLMIRGRVEQRYRGGEFYPQIKSISFMREVQDNIKEFCITLNISDVTMQETSLMKKLFADNPGNTKVKIKIQDLNAGISLSLMSQNIRIYPSIEVGDFFDQRQIKYSLR